MNITAFSPAYSVRTQKPSFNGTSSPAVNKRGAEIGKIRQFMENNQLQIETISNDNGYFSFISTIQHPIEDDKHFIIRDINITNPKSGRQVGIAIGKSPEESEKKCLDSMPPVIDITKTVKTIDKERITL